MEYLFSIGKRLGLIKKDSSGSFNKSRLFYVGNNVPLSDLPPGHQTKFPSNHIISSNYTLWNFLPKNLLNQFRRIANMWFLIIGVVQFVHPDSPTHWMTSVIPLTIVIASTAVKQGFEDYKKHKSDSELNDRGVLVVRENQLVQIPSHEVRVGDIIKVETETVGVLSPNLPCDIVILSTYFSSGECYIKTTNLDGETNLKTKCCVPELRELTDIDYFKDVEISIECPRPTEDLYKFNGVMTIHNTKKSIEQGVPLVVTARTQPTMTEAAPNWTLPVNADNILLRGSKLHDTPFIWGCALFTGHDTKMSLNSKNKRHKLTRVEEKANHFLTIYIIILVLLCSTLVILKMLQIGERRIYMAHQGFPSKAIGSETVSFSGFLTDFLSFLILTNFIIPISLYVTMEFQKFVGVYFIEGDLKMYDEKTDERAITNTSDLNEELGQVEYLFADKTGTLTQNHMVFRYCAVGPEVYMTKGPSLCMPQPDPEEECSRLDDGSFPEDVERLVLSLCLCHSIRVQCSVCGPLSGSSIKPQSTVSAIPSGRNVKRAPSSIKFSKCKHDPFRNWHYQSSSPDETALVEACRRFGYIFAGNSNSISSVFCPVKHRDVKERESGLHRIPFHRVPTASSDGGFDHTTWYKVRMFEVFNTFDFDSDRKRMSVLVREVGDDGPYRLITKGADSTVIPICKPDPSFYSKATSTTSKAEAEAHTQTFSQRGLRVLCVADRLVTQNEFDAITDKILRAETSNTKRSARAVGANYLMSEKEWRGIAARDDESPEGRLDSLLPDNLVRTTPSKVKLSLKKSRHTIQVARHDRHPSMGNPDQVIDVYNEIERDLNLVGITAVEDKLQEHVPETLQALRLSGIKVWVLTGDKQETAVNISLAARHFGSPYSMDNTKASLNSIPRSFSPALARSTVGLYYATNNSKPSAVDVNNGNANDDEDNPYRVFELVKLTNVRATIKALSNIRSELKKVDSEGSPLKAASSILHHITTVGDKWRALLSRIPLVSRFYPPLTVATKYLPTTANLVVDGATLAVILHNETTKTMFAEICGCFAAVLCCRCSPIQKAEVVKIVKNFTSKPVTAAIGDGANDVSMILEAHVGIGLMGKEGRAAVRSSDYAIAKFHFIRRLLHVHGRYFYVRVATLCNYFFYKNVILVMAQVLYAAYCLHSGTSLFDDFLLLWYNPTYTGFPILLYGLFEKDIPESVIKEHPQHYKSLSRNTYLSYSQFFAWNLLGMIHSSIAFFVCYLSIYRPFYKDTVSLSSDSKSLEFPDFGYLVMTSLVLICTLKLEFHMAFRPWPFQLSVFLTLFCYFAFNIAFHYLCTVSPSVTSLTSFLLDSAKITFISGQCWLVVILAVATALMFDVVYAAVRSVISTKRKALRGATLEEVFPPLQEPGVKLKAVSKSGPRSRYHPTLGRPKLSTIYSVSSESFHADADFSSDVLGGRGNGRFGNTNPCFSPATTLTSDGSSLAVIPPQPSPSAADVENNNHLTVPTEEENVRRRSAGSSSLAIYRDGPPEGQQPDPTSVVTNPSNPKKDA